MEHMEIVERLEILERQVLPQVLPCPRSMVADALQAVALDFCKVTEVWTQTLLETAYQGEMTIEAGLPKDAEIVRARKVMLDGSLLTGGEFHVSGKSIVLRTAVRRDCDVVIDAVLRPSRFAEAVPRALLEEWGDVISYGALAKIKGMSGRHVDWSDPQGAAIALQQYNEGTARAKARAIRIRNGGGALYAVGAY